MEIKRKEKRSKIERDRSTHARCRSVLFDDSCRRVRTCVDRMQLELSNEYFLKECESFLQFLLPEIEIGLIETEIIHKN